MAVSNTIQNSSAKSGVDLAPPKRRPCACPAFIGLVDEMMVFSIEVLRASCTRRCMDHSNDLRNQKCADTISLATFERGGVWYDGGNLIVQGCPVLVVPHHGTDVAHFFAAVFNPISFNLFVTRAGFSAIIAAFRLGTTCEIQGVPRNALTSLFDVYPSHFADFVDVGLDPSYCQDQIIPVIQFSCEHSIDWILPLAFYCFCFEMTGWTLHRGATSGAWAARSVERVALLRAPHCSRVRVACLTSTWLGLRRRIHGSDQNACRTCKAGTFVEVTGVHVRHSGKADDPRKRVGILSELLQKEQRTQSLAVDGIQDSVSTLAFREGRWHVPPRMVGSRGIRPGLRTAKTQNCTAPTKGSGAGAEIQDTLTSTGGSVGKRLFSLQRHGSACDLGTASECFKGVAESLGTSRKPFKGLISVDGCK
ncbi:hypothetical protein K438DRAFT_1785759 [Mycena galopus ATCC 62051]|nr:hypothetical protein K438DRAFT_1785759 [Mycena galopus ATCC 62051]